MGKPNGYDRQMGLILNWRRSSRLREPMDVGESVGRYIAQHFFLSIYGCEAADTGECCWWVLGATPNFWSAGYSDWKPADHMDIVVYGLRHTHLLENGELEFWQRLIKDLDRYDEDRALRLGIPATDVVEKLLLYSDVFKGK
jgi:hypothetical protein